MAPHRTGADRLVLSISDVEMGAGGPHDDFPHTAWLGELICAYNRPPFADLPIDLVWNGDTFDLLKTSIDNTYPVVVDAAAALAKLDRILAAHPEFPEACRRFLSHPGAPRRMHFVVGNHDYELVFPEVQERLRAAIDHDNVTFPGFEVDFGDLHIEHGSQDDPMFQVDPDHTLVPHDGRTILAQPWGAQAVIEAALPMQAMFFDLDRLKPRKRVFELLPDVRDFVVGAFRQYYGTDWLRGYVAGVPNRRISWKMLREVVWRFRTADPDILEAGHYKRMVMAGRYKCVVIGHLHSAAWWSWADRKVLHTGCLRDEFAIDATGSVAARIPKSYAEIYLRDDHAFRSHLVEVDGPAPPAWQAPATVFDVLPRIRPQLEAGSEVRALGRTAADATEPPEED